MKATLLCGSPSFFAFFKGKYLIHDRITPSQREDQDGGMVIYWPSVDRSLYTS